MLDCQMFGLRSGWHHLTNVLLHALAVLLLFAFLNRSTGRRWPSAWVALLFALHPLHVESVAWVAERKDSLSAFFGLLALWSYVRYVERPALRRYLLVVLTFGLGLMAKPMLVTLPFLLLLVDVWPLGRVSGRPWSRIAPLLSEKIPLFALSAAAAGATYLVQQAGGAVRSRDAFPLVLRLENALVSYIVYIAKMFWPARLAVFYPYPAEVPAWQAAAAALAIAAVSMLVLRSVRKRPYLAVGWLWYLVTLAPVIGLVQVGAQARADRYTYIPMIGLTIMLAWGAADLLGRVPRAKPAVAVLAAAVCAGCAAITWLQAGYWRDSRTLFQHAVDVTNGNYLAHHNLGVALAESPADLNQAIAHFQAVLQIKPDYARAHTDLGSALAKLPGRLPDAMAEFRATTSATRSLRRAVGARPSPSMKPRSASIRITPTRATTWRKRNTTWGSSWRKQTGRSKPSFTWKTRSVSVRIIRRPTTTWEWYCLRCPAASMKPSAISKPLCRSTRITPTRTSTWDWRYPRCPAAFPRRSLISKPPSEASPIPSCTRCWRG
jgi:tetratricopeptide (TPR) repeat protein